MASRGGERTPNSNFLSMSKPAYLCDCVVTASGSSAAFRRPTARPPTTLAPPLESLSSGLWQYEWVAFFSKLAGSGQTCGAMIIHKRPHRPPSNRWAEPQFQLDPRRPCHTDRLGMTACHCILNSGNTGYRCTPTPHPSWLLLAALECHVITL